MNNSLNIDVIKYFGALRWHVYVCAASEALHGPRALHSPVVETTPQNILGCVRLEPFLQRRHIPPVTTGLQTTFSQTFIY